MTSRSPDNSRCLVLCVNHLRLPGGLLDHLSSCGRLCIVNHPLLPVRVPLLGNVPLTVSDKSTLLEPPLFPKFVKIVAGSDTKDKENQNSKERQPPVPAPPAIIVRFSFVGSERF